MVLKSIGILYGLILYLPISVVKQWKELSKNCNVLHFLNNCSCIFNKGTFVISMLKHLLLKSILVKKNLDP